MYTSTSPLILTSMTIDGERRPVVVHAPKNGFLYVLDRRVCDRVPCDTQFDLPHLVWRLLECGERVGSYLYDGFWLDIGRHEDYAAAIEQFEELKPALLREESVGADGLGLGASVSGNGNANGHGSGAATYTHK